MCWWLNTKETEAFHILAAAKSQKEKRMVMRTKDEIRARLKKMYAAEEQKLDRLLAKKTITPRQALDELFEFAKKKVTPLIKEWQQLDREERL